MTPEGVGDMEEWKQRVTQDISELKQGHTNLASEQSKQKDDIRDLQMSRSLQAQEINALKGDIIEIKDDTNFIRRRITGAIITAVVTVVITALLGFMISQVFGIPS